MLWYIRGRILKIDVGRSEAIGPTTVGVLLTLPPPQFARGTRVSFYVHVWEEDDFDSNDYFTAVSKGRTVAIACRGLI